MKKIFLSIFLVFIFASIVLADRDEATTTAYSATETTSTIVKLGDAKVYSINFTATSNGGFFVVLDAASNTTSTGSIADVKAEGGEATALNYKLYDYSNKPLEFSTGLVLIVSNGIAILRYE